MPALGEKTWLRTPTQGWTGSPSEPRAVLAGSRPSPPERLLVGVQHHGALIIFDIHYLLNWQYMR